MKKISNFLDSIVKYIIIITLAAMLVIMNVQVFYRFVLNHALPWPEEAIVIIMLWSMYLSAAILVKENGHIALDFFVEHFPIKRKKILNLINNFLIIIFLGIIVFFGFKLSITVFNIKTGALRISRMIPYIAIPISACLMILYIIQNSENIIKNK